MFLKVQDLQLSYRSRPALQGVSFELREGEILMVLGNNGAGKSTLLKCINRILRPRCGTVLLDGHDLGRLSQREIARHIGYLPQNQQPWRITVFDAVALGRRPHIGLNPSPADLRLVEEVIERLNLGDLALRYLDELSGGELQKVMVARALAQKPDLLLLDEPVSNLDVRNQIELLRYLQDEVRERKISCMVAMHDLNMAIRFGHQFLLLRGGKIYAQGGREIINEDNLRAVYGLGMSLHYVQGMPVIVPSLP